MNLLGTNTNPNNNAEAAHHRLKNELGTHHPTIWKLIDGLRKVQKGRDVYYEKLLAGHQPQQKQKKYVLFIFGVFLRFLFTIKVLKLLFGTFYNKPV